MENYLYPLVTFSSFYSIMGSAFPETNASNMRAESATMDLAYFSFNSSPPKLTAFGLAVLYRKGTFFR
jgi:hypothetical protein